MATVRELLELMHENVKVEIKPADSMFFEFCGDVSSCLRELPNAALDCEISKIYSGNYSIYILRRQRNGI